MSRPYAVAGADIERGMTIQLSPDEPPFVVLKVEPYPQADTWLWVFRDANRMVPVQKNAWYADLSDRVEVSAQEKGGEQGDPPLGLVIAVGNDARAGGAGLPDSPCSLCDEVGGHMADCPVIL